MDSAFAGELARLLRAEQSSNSTVSKATRGKDDERQAVFSADGRMLITPHIHHEGTTMVRGDRNDTVSGYSGAVEAGLPVPWRATLSKVSASGGLKLNTISTSAGKVACIFVNASDTKLKDLEVKACSTSSTLDCWKYTNATHEVRSENETTKTKCLEPKQKKADSPIQMSTCNDGSTDQDWEFSGKKSNGYSGQWVLKSSGVDKRKWCMYANKTDVVLDVCCEAAYRWSATRSSADKAKCDQFTKSGYTKMFTAPYNLNAR